MSSKDGSSRSRLRTLELGRNVVLDFGLWSRDERSALRQAGADAGADVVICSFELSTDEQRQRIDARWNSAPHETWAMSEEELTEWAANFDVPTPGELDGTEPIDDPPNGFATWREWTAFRWPPSASVGGLEDPSHGRPGEPG
jgi:predicted kinase